MTQWWILEAGLGEDSFHVTQTINSPRGSALLGSGCCFNHLLRAPALLCWATLGPAVPPAPVPWGRGCHAPAGRGGFQLKFNATQSGLGPGPCVPAQRVCAHVWWLLLRDVVAVTQLLDVLELWQRGLCWVPVMRIPLHCSQRPPEHPLRAGEQQCRGHFGFSFQEEYVATGEDLGVVNLT